MIDPLNVVYGNTEIRPITEISPTYNKKTRDDNLDIDDKVFVYLPRNERAKLKCKWMGPYKIVEAHHLT